MIINMSLDNFLEELSSSSPTPGGGSVSALGACIAAGLFEMVIRISYKNIEEDMKQYKEILTPLKEAAKKLIDEDSSAFDQVMKAYALPKSNDEEKKIRRDAIQESLKLAAKAPLETSKICIALMRLTAEITVLSKESCVSDAAVGYNFAQAGFKGAIHNVVINLSSIKDEDFVNSTKKEIEELEKWYEENKEPINLVLCQRLKL